MSYKGLSRIGSSCLSSGPNLYSVSNQDVEVPLAVGNIRLILKMKLVPDQLRIGTDAPNEKVPLARFDFQKNWTARVIRKN